MVKQLNPGSYVLVVTNALAVRMGFTAGGATTWNGDFKPDDSTDTPPGDGDVAGGLWVGESGSDYSLCLNVSRDGTLLTQNGSECRSAFGDREALFVEYARVENACDEYVDNLDLDRNIPIVNNSFRVDVDIENLPLLPPVGVIVEGTFADGVLRGTVTQRNRSTRCSGDFVASPQ